MKIIWAIVLYSSIQFVVYGAIVDGLADLRFNVDNRLEHNYLLFNQACDVAPVWQAAGHMERELAMFSDSFADKLFAKRSEGECRAVCLERGTHRDQTAFPLLKYKYDGPLSEVGSWLSRDCQTVEVGFMQYHSKKEISFSWVDGAFKRRIGNIGWGEKHVRWHTSQIGHKFQMEDEGRLLSECTVLSNQVCIVGEAPAHHIIHDDYTMQVQHTLSNEWNRSRAIQRTYTRLGFNKGRLPADLWGSISAYYYNNKNNRIREEWSPYAFHVNWWQVDVEFIPMPWQLKSYWQTRLMDLVSDWAGGVTLERTDIYGMRRYHDGARLLSHVDREATHALSLIINVDQGGMRNPWPLEIYDLADRLHEVYMEPGDIVYYESARCLHGRQQAMEGEFFVNLFSHYRALGDPDWFRKKNPPDAPLPLVDIGKCKNVDGRAVCDGGFDIPTLSAHLEKVAGPNDLFAWWQKTTDPNVGNRKRGFVTDAD